MAECNAIFCVDMGTTRTRVWVCENDFVWAHVAKDFGVRDVARGGTREMLASHLSELLSHALGNARVAGLLGSPTLITAAGMITSPLGLANVAHISVPAGMAELASAIYSTTLKLDSDLPLLLVPGLVTGVSTSQTNEVFASDVMRGEEVLVMGLLAKKLLSPSGAVLNLGSHWKFIQTNGDSKITGSRTALTGEMIHAIQTQTLLASALPQDRPDALDAEWLRIGGEEEARSGLSRSLFCVRLLEQMGNATPQQRLSFLYGAFIEAELRALLPLMPKAQNSPLCLVGALAVAKAWQQRLIEAAIPSVIVEEGARDISYLTALQELVRIRQSHP